MRMAAVRDCLRVLKHFGIDPALTPAIDIGGTRSVFLLEGERGRTTDNPLLAVNRNLTLLDRGFNAEEFATGQDETLDFLDPRAIEHLRDRFAMVFCFDTLEHVSNPFIFADHLMQIARPGGFVYVSTVFSWVYHPSPEDYFRYSPTGLRQVFQDGVNSSRDRTSIIWCDWESDERAVALLAYESASVEGTPFATKMAQPFSLRRNPAQPPTLPGAQAKLRLHRRLRRWLRMKRRPKG